LSERIALSFEQVFLADELLQPTVLGAIAIGSECRKQSAWITLGQLRGKFTEKRIVCVS
jgi:hypothetical protein